MSVGLRFFFQNHITFITTLFPIVLLSSLLVVSTAIEAEVKLPSCVTSQPGVLKHPGIYHDCKSLDRIQDNYQGNRHTLNPWIMPLVDFLLCSLTAPGPWPALLKLSPRLEEIVTISLFSKTKRMPTL